MEPESYAYLHPGADRGVLGRAYDGRRDPYWTVSPTPASPRVDRHGIDRGCWRLKVESGAKLLGDVLNRV